MELKEKVALVTGGGTGLGRAVVLRLAGEGMNVAINYSKSKAEADETVEAAKALGVKAAAFKADVSSTREAEDLVKEVEKTFGRLDLLVNNAGTTKFVPFKDLEGLSEDDWLRLFRINTMPSFFTSRAAAKIMRRLG